ncbi:caspase family protein [Fimbriiglobus ruber]|uniref:WD-40 repeat protein n=1 Tax=Fimbriiglobus ruber TaxID=1908690 RepID=A0A225DEU2_9BACT|nr:caspase family protein [Fimbriiglobus ruber]OWK34905.1 WD-40 repeat protein [Fimbriiglobus ruber]
MKKYAILIAVEEYLDKAIDQVDYAANDAIAFSNALAEHGFDKADQVVLINNQATRGVIESQVRRVTKRLRKGDILYFYYAGHGFSKGAKNFLTCHDTLDADWDGTSVALAPIFGELQASDCERIVLFLDCCESGVKATSGRRGIYDNLKGYELEAFLDDAKHCFCFAACRSDESSWSSPKLKHGIWTHHVIEAFKGDAPLALERNRYLTANSLQNYLKSEVPRTLRKTHTTKEDQTPWTYGASSGDFKLADLGPILEERREKANKGVTLITELSFTAEETESLKSLSGWKKHYRIPSYHNHSAEEFAASCAFEELKEDLDTVFNGLKKAFGFVRRDLEAPDPERSSGGIITPYFDYSVSVSLNPDDLSEVIWTRTVDTIKNPEQVTSDAFAQVFNGVFDTLKFSLPTMIKIDDFIDAVEAAKIPELEIEHDRGAKYCTLELDGAVGKITLTTTSLSITHSQAQNPKQLIASFTTLRKLAQRHNVPLLSFTSSQKQLPPGKPTP